MIRSVDIQNFRCFTSVDLVNLRNINLFSGGYSSGKSSILESIFFCLRGKSFRPARRRVLIGNSSYPASVSLGMDDFSVLSTLLTADNAQHYLNHNSVPQIQTVLNYPVFYCSRKFDFFSPHHRYRRNILFSILFYMFPQFHSLWRDYEKIHNTRLVLTKQIFSGLSSKSIIPWNHQLHQMLIKIDFFFLELNMKVTPLFKKVASKIFPGKSLDIHFNSGFSQEFFSNIVHVPDYHALRYEGPHRSSYIISSSNFSNANPILSDSELFISSIVLIYCAIPFFHKKLPTFVLIDDLDSNLFPQFQLIIDSLENLLCFSDISDVQSFITSNFSFDNALISPRLQMFHVEHL